MRMRDSLIEVYSILNSDEELLRLLYYNNTDVYKISDINDANHPLNTSRDNILSKPDSVKWDIIYDLIKTTKTTDGLDINKKNRICIYSGRRKPNTERNYRISKQTIFIDVYSPIAFDEIDFRLSWISDRINDLLFDDSFSAGMGNLGFTDGGLIETSDFSYNGYRLMYSFNDFN